jgi:putative acyl-CoA dehydrogenase
MQNVLADLALESEAALTLTMRVGRALDQRDTSEHEDLLVRLVTAVGKYWICKRTPQHAYESMECIGGSGVMEDSMFPRLYREAPVNAIWEGSGNIQCLDVLRAMGKTPAVVDAYFAELAVTRGANAMLDAQVAALQREFADMADLQYRARHVVEKMAVTLQASLLVRHAPGFVADAFVSARLGDKVDTQYGTLPRGVDVASIIARATPKMG